MSRSVEANGIKLPLALSLAGHAIILALIALFVAGAPPLPLPAPSRGIRVAVVPVLPQPAAPPLPAPPPPSPPPPAPPPVAIAPPPLPPPPAAREAAPILEPPPRKPAVPLPHPVPRRREPARPPRTAAPPPPQPAMPPAAPPVPAAAPRLPAAAAPSTAISPGYRVLLGAWLERHKRYPESARERGEEGRAILRFVVDRNGRVSDFAVVESSGYPDLDAAVESMMQGATLPPFPADMRQSSIEVRVPIQFRLAR